MTGVYAFSAVLLATALSAPAAQSQSDQSNPERDQLEYFQGHAYMGSESVKWEHDRLVFVKRVADMKGSFRETVERLDPPPESWERFWARIDSLGVWHWKSDYNDPKRDFPDGESWSLALRYRAKELKSKGYNAVPDGYSGFRDAVYKLMEDARRRGQGPSGKGRGSASATSGSGKARRDLPNSSESAEA